MQKTVIKVFLKKKSKKQYRKKTEIIQKQRQCNLFIIIRQIPKFWDLSPQSCTCVRRGFRKKQ